jgi:hypothetical protein
MLILPITMQVWRTIFFEIFTLYLTYIAVYLRKVTTVLYFVELFVISGTSRYSVLCTI